MLTLSRNSFGSPTWPTRYVDLELVAHPVQLRQDAAERLLDLPSKASTGIRALIWLSYCFGMTWQCGQQDFAAASGLGLPLSLSLSLSLAFPPSLSVSLSLASSRTLDTK